MTDTPDPIEAWEAAKNADVWPDDAREALTPAGDALVVALEAAQREQSADPLAAHRTVPMGFNGDDDEWAEEPDG